MGYYLAKKIRGVMENSIHKKDPRCFFDKQEFPWHQELESSYPAIRKECESILPQLSSITNFDAVLPNQRALHHKDQWKSFFLMANKEFVPKHREICPETCKALQQIPGVLNAFYSILAPGVDIKPHRGPYSGMLRCHLGLIIPEGEVYLIVNDQKAQWHEGECLFFDDSFQHSAKNDSNSIRVVLFIDFVRPLNQPLRLINKMMMGLFFASGTAKAAKQYINDNQL